jgi:hypothetical protein
VNKEQMISRAVKIGQNPEVAAQMLDEIFKAHTNISNLVFELHYWGFITNGTANKMLGIK